jgi:hypothetical protein
LPTKDGGTLRTVLDARTICNGLGIMRACLETQKLEQLESRMDEIADRVAHERTGASWGERPWVWKRLGRR